MAHRSYIVEFRDEHGEPASVRGRSENEDLSDGRAQEIASWYVRKFPERMCFINQETQKGNGQDKLGREKVASRVDVIHEVQGTGYHGPRPRSTMQRQGRI